MNRLPILKSTRLFRLAEIFVVQSGAAKTTGLVLPWPRMEFPETTNFIWPLEDKGSCWGTAILTYGREDIVEGYYTAHVGRGAFVAPDVQHIWHPGYNRDRGPVWVPGMRLHLEF